MDNEQITTQTIRMDHDRVRSKKSHSELFKVDDSDLRLVNRFLILCSLGLVALVALRVFKMEEYLAAEPPSIHRNVAYKSPAISPFASAEDYAAAVSKRSVMYSTQPSDSAQNNVSTPSSRSEILKRLDQTKREFLVVGVAWKTPKVVMLFDKKKRKTYQLRIGQKVGSGEVVVDAISREKIVLSLKKEKVVISL